MKLKRVLPGVAALGVATLAFAGCSSGDTQAPNSTNQSGSASGKAEQVELRWAMSADSQAEVDVWQNLADRVTKEYPHIKIKLETTAYKDYYNKLTTQAAGNDLPCIAGLQAQRVPDVGELFVPLDDKLTGLVDIQDYEASIVEGLTKDGDLLAVPYDLGPYVIFYNIDMFKEAGLDAPEPGWTKEQFLEAAHALTQNGKYGYAVDGTPDMWLPYVLSIGGNYLDEDGNPDLTNPKVVEGFTFVTDLVTKEKVAPAPPATGASNWPADQWRNGNVAMVIDGPWQLINARNSVSFEVGLTTTPAFDGTSITTMSGTGFGVTTSCANPDEAAQAISVIIGPESQQYIAEKGRGFPAYKAAQDYWYEVANVPTARAAIETALETVDPFRTSPGWNRVNSLLQQYAVEAFNGQATPEEVLTNVQSQID